MAEIREYNYINCPAFILPYVDDAKQLLAYGIVHGFSQDCEGEFNGSINYICRWLKCSRPTAIKVMQDLEDKGLVTKRQVNYNGVTFNKYTAIIPKNLTGSQISLLPSKISLPNNIDDIINSVRENNKEDNLTLFNQEVKEKEKEENSYLLIFDTFRRAYRGSKRGNETEFKNFVKKHADWKEILPKLLDMYKSQCALLDERARRNLFVPQPKNLQTYINQRCWEEEIILEDYGNDTRKNQSRIQYGNAWGEFNEHLRSVAGGQAERGSGSISGCL